MDALQLIPLAERLVREGMLGAGQGSLSYRAFDRVVITGREVPLERLLPEHLVSLLPEGEALASDEQHPPLEWPLHLHALRLRPEARLVVFAVPIHAVALGLLGMALPALTPHQLRLLGPSVPLVPYRPPHSTQLARAAAESLRTAPTVLLQNNGVLVCGETPEQIRQRLATLEQSCAIFLAARAAGHPRALTEDETRALQEAWEPVRESAEREPPTHFESKGTGTGA